MPNPHPQQAVSEEIAIEQIDSALCKRIVRDGVGEAGDFQHNVESVRQVLWWLSNHPAELLTLRTSSTAVAGELPDTIKDLESKALAVEGKPWAEVFVRPAEILESVNFARTAQAEIARLQGDLAQMRAQQETAAQKGDR